MSVHSPALDRLTALPREKFIFLAVRVNPAREVTKIKLLYLVVIVYKERIITSLDILKKFLKSEL